MTMRDILEDIHFLAGDLRNFDGSRASSLRRSTTCTARVRSLRTTPGLPTGPSGRAPTRLCSTDDSSITTLLGRPRVARRRSGR